MKVGTLSTMLLAATVATGALGVRESRAGQGATIPGTLYTDPSSGRQAAKGVMRDARETPDSVSYIGCWRVYWESATVLTCMARDAAGTYLACSTSNPLQVDAINAITDSTQLRFQVDSAGKCAVIDVMALSTTAR